jgi:plastocyanin
VKRIIICAAAGASLAAGGIAAGGIAAQAGGHRAAAPGAQAAAAQKLRLRAVERNGLRFSRKTLVARHGRVRITMLNPKNGRLPHAIAVEGHGIDKDGKVVQPGGRSTVTVRVRKGTYEFYCPVGQHRQAGMAGKLIVR